jgi:hypothetical protein
MALFANITAAGFKKGDIIMFAMVSGSPDQMTISAMDAISSIWQD